MYNAANRKDIRRAEKASAIADAERLGVTKTIMSTAPGRAWMWDLLSQCHIGMNPHRPDTHQTSFTCGELNIGLRLWADILATCPDQYVLMSKEAHERNTASERRIGPNSNGRDSGSTGEADDGSEAIDGADGSGHDQEAGRRFDH